MHPFFTHNTHSLCQYSMEPLWNLKAAYHFYFYTFCPSNYAATFNAHCWLPYVLAAQSRCLYCEFMGIRIVQPVGIDFHGRELEFEKVVCGEDPCGENIVPILRKPFYNNLDIVNNRTLIAEAVGHRVKEDSLYDNIDDIYEQKRQRILRSKCISPADVLFLIPCSSYY